MQIDRIDRHLLRLLQEDAARAVSALAEAAGEEALTLARELTRVGTLMGKRVVAFVTDMDAPLGRRDDAAASGVVGVLAQHLDPPGHEKRPPPPIASAGNRFSRPGQSPNCISNSIPIPRLRSRCSIRKSRGQFTYVSSSMNSHSREICRRYRNSKP